MNPIEMLWSKVKALLRKWESRTAELLPETVSCALLCVSQRDSSAGLRLMNIACNLGNCYNISNLYTDIKFLTKQTKGFLF
ncbi:MAG: hypothetical protein L6V84_00370 [Oscillospiraceae bacterium]|nr:MAG: hypothetical protein L6V84_00370 [Oscillospiraceae bacterium]